jgi:two-component system chemotaxis response regulator CheY
MREMVAFLLRSAGYVVLEADDGEQALSIAKARQVDVVLTDQNMPRVDGLALVTNLRAMPAYRDTPIIILTTEASAELKLKGREAGATAWMVKPFDPDKLVTLLKTVIGMKPPQGQ